MVTDHAQCTLCPAVSTKILGRCKVDRISIKPAVELFRCHGKIRFVGCGQGNMPALLSHYRPDDQIFTFTENRAVQRRLALYHGVTALHMRFGETADETFDRSASPALSICGELDRYLGNERQAVLLCNDAMSAMAACNMMSCQLNVSWRRLPPWHACLASLLTTNPHISASLDKGDLCQVRQVLDVQQLTVLKVAPDLKAVALVGVWQGDPGAEGEGVPGGGTAGGHRAERAAADLAFRLHARHPSAPGRARPRPRRLTAHKN